MDGTFFCAVEVKKDVKWNQETLAKFWDQIVASGEEPTVYLKREFKVSEAALKTWGPHVRETFEAARTVRHGKPSYRIEPIEKGAS
jgi:hypothetical protein